MSSCYCCSGKLFANCCEPYLLNNKQAPDAQALMRSRFSAYCTSNYDYILATYGAEQRKKLTCEALKGSAGESRWLALDVIDFNAISNQTANVEFIATYADSGNLYRMHELSNFELQDGTWRYTTGQMKEHTGKLKMGRNDPCFCKSGKKFKQCCMRKL